MTDNHIPTPKEAPFRKVVQLHPKAVEKAVDTAYPEIVDAPKRSYSYKARGPRPAEVRDSLEGIGVHPAVLRLALEMAEGDKRRVELCPDGSVIIWNNENRPSGSPVHRKYRADMWDRVRKSKIEPGPLTRTEVIERTAKALGVDMAKAPEAPKAKLTRAESNARLGKLSKARAVPKETVEALVADRRDNNLSFNALARKYGISNATVSKYLSEAGLTSGKGLSAFIKPKALTDDQAIEAATRHEAGEKIAHLADAYGVSWATMRSYLQKVES